jgi:hypothetical protein
MAVGPSKIGEGAPGGDQEGGAGWVGAETHARGAARIPSPRSCGERVRVRSSHRGKPLHKRPR